MTKTRCGFKLSVTEGSFNDSQIIVMLGENGTGKTTFIRMLVHTLFLSNIFCSNTKISTFDYNPQDCSYLNFRQDE